MIAPDLGYREQILNSLSVKPDIGGVIHGLRPVLRGNPYRRVSSFSSQKAGGTFLLEGGIEATIALCLESSAKIARWATQGIRISLSRKEWVLLDFVAKKVDGSLIAIEGKPSIKGLSPQQLERYRHAENLLDREGIEFKLVDSYMLPTKFQADKLRHLYVRGHQQKWNSEITQIAKSILLSANCKTISQARATLVRENIPAEICDYLVFHKAVSFQDATNNSMEFIV